jgi:hypothetical protein
MSWFNTYERDGDGLTRVVRTEIDLSEMLLRDWTEEELGFRLAVIYPQVDGHEHLTAPEEIKTEVEQLLAEIERRGWDPHSNLMWNERCVGFGWQPGFWKRTG